MALKLMAPILLLVGGLHLLLGPQADVLLGAKLPLEALADPTLDSQNRFYGVAFTLYGLVLYLSATDLPRFRPMLLAALAVFFAAGLARLVSIALLGLPPAPVLFLLALELIAPPGLALWLRRVSPPSGAGSPSR